MNRTKRPVKRTPNPRASGFAPNEPAHHSIVRLTRAEIISLERYKYYGTPLPLPVIKKMARNHRIPLDWIIAFLQERGIQVGHA